MVVKTRIYKIDFDTLSGDFIIDGHFDTYEHSARWADACHAKMIAERLEAIVDALDNLELAVRDLGRK